MTIWWTSWLLGWGLSCRHVVTVCAWQPLRANIHFMLQRADLAICDLTITQEREQMIDFTMPFMNLGEWPESLMTWTVANKITDKHVARLWRDAQIPDFSISPFDWSTYMATTLTFPCRFHFLDPKRFQNCWRCWITAFWTIIFCYMICFITKWQSTRCPVRNVRRETEWQTSDKRSVSEGTSTAHQAKASPVGHSSDAHNSKDAEHLPHGILLPNFENQSDGQLFLMHARFHEAFPLTWNAVWCIHTEWRV